jgi:uncharacterized protein (DUF2235 family)
MKRIAIFGDGTWNSPEQGEATSVLRFARAVKPVADDGVEQVAFYDWGVGTDRKQISGGITGEGIDKNIQDAFRFLVHNYESGGPGKPADQLFFFGFSRGAYTVRSLGGFIRNCGILKREKAHLIPDAYDLYRKRGKKSHPTEKLARDFRRAHAVADKTDIEFIGVWDTVGALGVPLPFWGALGGREHLFHDTEPSSIINHARDALSSDENREDFAPALWDAKPGVDIQQVWFASVHSDVGGGYEERGLSDCAAQWMIQEAESFKLQFEPHLAKSVKPDFRGKMHNECKGMFAVRGAVGDGKYVRTIVGTVHESAKERWDKNVDGYRKKSKALEELPSTTDMKWD